MKRLAAVVLASVILLLTQSYAGAAVADDRVLECETMTVVGQLCAN